MFMGPYFLQPADKVARVVIAVFVVRVVILSFYDSAVQVSVFIIAAVIMFMYLESFKPFFRLLPALRPAADQRLFIALVRMRMFFQPADCPDPLLFRFRVFFRER